MIFSRLHHFNFKLQKLRVITNKEALSQRGESSTKLAKQNSQFKTWKHRRI